MFDLVCAARVIGAPPLRQRVVIDDPARSGSGAPAATVARPARKNAAARQGGGV
ncbi:MAG: hypothetical protein N3D71_06450 [Burkholderiaceae bacterium]|nr:hypothetical protein [Burkholderiaceae bacterium]